MKLLRTERKEGKATGMNNTFKAIRIYSNLVPFRRCYREITKELLLRNILEEQAEAMLPRNNSSASNEEGISSRACGSVYMIEADADRA